MTVAELIALLQQAPGNLEVVVRAQDDEGSDYCGTVGTAAVESNEEGPFFAIDCGPEESDDWDGGEEEEGEEEDGAGEEEEEEEEAGEGEEGVEGGGS